MKNAYAIRKIVHCQNGSAARSSIRIRSDFIVKGKHFIKMDIIFFVNSILLGVGLAMDAFSVSISNGLAEPDMGRWKRGLIAGTYSLFQFLMPMAGWFFVRFAAGFSRAFHHAIPWIALALLLYIGGNMLIEGIKEQKKPEEAKEEPKKESDDDSAKMEERQPEQMPEKADGGERLTISILLLQGIATSIDAFSVGFTIADYNVIMALTAALLIGGVTFVICLAGIRIGQVLGDIVGSKASILGGLLLIGIGIEIFINNIFL